jgi:hypothetical protein
METSPKNYNDQPDLIEAYSPGEVKVEGKVYHELTEAELGALQKLRNGELFAQEKRAREYKEERWDYVQLAQKNGAMYHVAKRCSSSAFQVFLYMSDHISSDNNALIVTRTHLSKVLGISLPTIKRALAQLRKAKVFDTVRVGNQTAYIFNAQIVWKGAVNQKQYAFFSTNVIADYDDQEKEQLDMWNDTSIDGGTPLNGRKNAELLNLKLKLKVEQHRRDLVTYLISHEIDPKSFIEFEDRKELFTFWEMPMDLKNPRWRPVIELYEGTLKKEPWALEFMGWNGEPVEH